MGVIAFIHSLIHFSSFLLKNALYKNHPRHGVKWSESHSVVSDSLWPHGLNSPGQNTGVGRHSLFQGILPSQESNLGLPITGEFFIRWATREVACVRSLFSAIQLCDQMDCSHKASLSMGFSRQEYWRGLPCPSPKTWWVPNKWLGIGTNTLAFWCRDNSLEKPLMLGTLKAEEEAADD